MGFKDYPVHFPVYVISLFNIENGFLLFNKAVDFRVFVPGDVRSAMAVGLPGRPHAFRVLEYSGTP